MPSTSTPIITPPLSPSAAPAGVWSAGLSWRRWSLAGPGPELRPKKGLVTHGARGTPAEATGVRGGVRELPPGSRWGRSLIRATGEPTNGGRDLGLAANRSSVGGARGGGGRRWSITDPRGCPRDPAPRGGSCPALPARLAERALAAAGGAVRGEQGGRTWGRPAARHPSPGVPPPGPPACGHHPRLPG